MAANLVLASRACLAQAADALELASGPAQAQVDPTIIHLGVSDANDLRFVRLSRSQGLSQQRVTNIVQDDRGFLWFGTQFGLNRYDGYRFRVFKHEIGNVGSLCAAFIVMLFKDRAGRLWVGCNYSVDRYDPVTERFVHYRLESPTLDDLNGAVSHICQGRDGRLWLSTGNGLYGLDPDTSAVQHFTHDSSNPYSLSSNEIKSSGEDRAGAFWVATGEGFDQFDWQRNRVTLHVPLREPKDLAFYEDREHTFWILQASGNGLSVLDRATRRLVHYSFAPKDLPGLPLTGVSSMLEDQDGTLWVGTFSDGVLKFDRVRRSFTRYRHDPANSESLSENRITTLFEDREGNIWTGFGATEPGYFVTRALPFVPIPFDSHNRRNLGETLVNTICEDRHGIIWIGTTGALNRLDPKTRLFTHLTVPGNGIASDVLSVVEDRSGEALWVGTSGQGLYRLDTATNRLQGFRHDDQDPASLSDDTVIRLFYDSLGQLWVGTLGGFNRFDSVKGKFTPYRHVGPYELHATQGIAEDRHGSIWVGTDGDGIFRFDPRTERLTLISPSGERERILYSVYVDHDGVVWVGSQNGLYRYEPDTGVPTRYTEQDGLPSNAVSCVAEDNFGELWMGTSEGVSRLDRSRHIFKNYSSADGLPGLDFTGWSACYRGASGDMYFGGFAGAVAFRPQNVPDSDYAPTVALTGFKLFGIPVALSPASPLSRAIDHTNSITLSHSQNSFSFEFAALGFRSPATNRYRYQLEGLDDSWHQVGSDERIASYTTMPAGRYRFHVQGATSRGPWGTPGTSVAIQILPAWWATWWFRAIYMALFAVAIAIAYIARMRQLTHQLTMRMQERVNERTRIGRELHDTVLQGLVSASLQLEVADRQIAADATAKPVVQRVSQLLRQLIDESRNTVRGLRLRRSEEENLERALTQISNDLAAPRKVKHQLVVEGTPRALRPLVREEIYRIGGEALANAFRHAGASAVEIVLEYGRDYFRLLVRDDGQGIDPEVLDAGREGHFGLSGLHERAEKIGARLKVRTAAGAGTEIDLLVPAVEAFERRPARGPMYWIAKLYSRDSRP